MIALTAAKTAIIIAKAVKAENVQLVETKILVRPYCPCQNDRLTPDRAVSGSDARPTTGGSLGRVQIRYDDSSSAGDAPGRRQVALGRIPDRVPAQAVVVLDPRGRDVFVLAGPADGPGPAILRHEVGHLSSNVTTAYHRPPSNLDLADFAEAGSRAPEPKPYDEPTFATYLILRRSLGEIVAKVTDHFQMLGESVQYRDVEEIDAEFKAFMGDLPRAFRMDEPDKTWDASESTAVRVWDYRLCQNCGFCLYIDITSRRRSCTL